MKTIEVKKRSQHEGVSCAQCGRRVKAGQWAIVHIDGSINPTKTYVTHSKCMAALVAKAGVDTDDKRELARIEWERRRQAIIDGGGIHVALEPEHANQPA